MPQILDGNELRDKLIPKLVDRIRLLGYSPTLIIIQIGNLRQSESYIQRKKIFGQEIGAGVIHKQYPEIVSEQEILTDIYKYNSDSNIHGIIVQLPIPPKLDKRKIIDAIDPHKDVDGLTAINTKSLFDNMETIIPATTQGIITLLNNHNINISGKKITIVGRSILVGKPTALALLNRDATVTICHTRTKNLAEKTKQADILIIATGCPKLITLDHVCKDQVIIDVGITVTEDNKIVGDVDQESVRGTVSAITPVPGGVGPMTVFSLFENLVKVCEMK